MQSFEQLLLMKIAEEASEVAQAALKAAQFGAVSKSPLGGPTNARQLSAELGDLFGVVQMLEYNYIDYSNLTTNATHMDALTAKSAKVLKFAMVQHKLSRLEWHPTFIAADAETTGE